MSIDENEGMSSESVGKLYVMGITYVVFANTDAYTKEIDKRIPFRNNILCIISLNMERMIYIVHMSC